MITPPLKTVRVDSTFFPDGVLINAEDFNPETDKLFSKPEAAADKTAAPEKVTDK